ncbi:hypothetical protein BH09VER1_BH09VER1_28740 [soil metagenome]
MIYYRAIVFAEWVVPSLDPMDEPGTLIIKPSREIYRIAATSQQDAVKAFKTDLNLLAAKGSFR